MSTISTSIDSQKGKKEALDNTSLTQDSLAKYNAHIPISSPQLGGKDQPRVCGKGGGANVFELFGV
jgi:hypothetical protein